MFNKGRKYIILFSLIQGFTSAVNAQEKMAKIDIHVMDVDSVSLKNVDIELNSHLRFKTNAKGNSEFVVPYGVYQLKVKLPNFEHRTISLVVDKDKVIPIILESNVVQLQEAVFTAKEDKGLTSKSVINRQAMSHLQPSSFSDLMELVPGGLAIDPTLTKTNVINLRESSDRPSSYNTSSLGVQFMVDDNIINSNSNFQKAVDGSALNGAAESRYTYNSGVDMRTISTNDIEKVEIIRGIPNASYGDLTSGLVKIERKIGQTPLQARLKVDGFSKQYYIGKGFKVTDNWSLNASFDYLDAQLDPTDETNNYNRITASIRSKLDFKLFGNPVHWRSNVDFNGTLDQTKIDPDTGYASIDRYKSYNRKGTFTNNFIYDLNKNNFFNKVILNTSIQKGYDRIEETKLVQYTGPRAISIAREPGENIGVFPPLSFISDSYTDGKPLDIRAKLETSGNKKTKVLRFDYSLGLDYSYSKNNGEGEIYDVTQPPNPAMTTRPRSFKSIPATENLAIYGGNTLNYKLGNHRFNLYTGFRVSTLLGIDSSYKLADKVFVEPRANLQYALPRFNIGNHRLGIDVTFGYGEFYKQPTNYYLYPDKQYKDYAQLSYYSEDPQYRYVNYMTYVNSLENKDLTAAKNVKKEIRVDFNYNRHQFSITYYHENMNNGFRQVTNYNIYDYKKYDVTAVNTNDWGPSGPNLENIPYEDIKTFGAYARTENGSVTDKEGIEFQYSSPRIQAINTRFTLSGAWFKTKYTNSVPYYYIPSVSVGNLEGGFPYVGVYANDEGYEDSRMNYNLMIDTYIPSLDLTFSASLQGTLFTNNYRLGRKADPYAYMDLNGNITPFTEEDKNDPYKQWLIRNTNDTDYMSAKTSYDINLNLKVTKSIYKTVKASMYVNRLFNYNNPYTFNGVKVDPRTGSTPYFGMEINYNF